MANNVYPVVSSTPGGSTSERPSNPKIGDTYYNGTVGLFQIYTSNGWLPINASAGIPLNTSAVDVGTSRAYNNGAATVSFDPAENGGFPSQFTALSTPGSLSTTGTESPLVVTGLSSNTSYTFGVAASNDLGTSAYSIASSAITITTVPQAPQSLTATASNFGAVTLNWTVGASGGKALSKQTATASPGGASVEVSGSATTTTFTGLTGGTEYTFTVNATNANGTSANTTATATPFSELPAEALIIAGGGSGMSGGGHDAGSAGGAGGYRSFANLGLPSSFTVTVGAGGAAVNNNQGNKGSNSRINNTYATGGGRGGFADAASNKAGGSGGGGLRANGGTGNEGGYDPVEGYAGSAGWSPDSWGGNYRGSGGGGASQSPPSPGHDGGAGLASSITGTSITRAGGGGGGSGWDTGNVPGAGGAGGGGQGTYATNAGPGATNTGSGGGGVGVTFSNQSTRNSGAGGSGLCVIAYPASYPAIASVGVGLTYSVDTSSRPGYRIYSFTAGTGTVSF